MVSPLSGVQAGTSEQANIARTRVQPMHPSEDTPAQQNRQQPKPDPRPSVPPGSVFVQFALELLQLRADQAHKRHP